MNPMQQVKDPAGNIPPQLLSHLHLVSKQRYPQSNSPPIETIVSYLIDGQKIIHENLPVQWQMLDCPTDGTIMLMWQPPDMGVNFASDGYVWNDHEQMFNSDVRGYSLQMYLHRAGFRPSEPMATHSRRRYRLIPTQQNVGGPMPDPNLWLIHYSKAQPRDHVPAAKIQILPQVHAQMQQRRMIMQQGALPRNEFMLRDRANWPTITPPGGGARPGPTGQVAGAHRRGPSAGVSEPSVEEEEDVSRGDALDFMTPREISRLRYEQNHEWMEEVLESPYSTLSIVPPELGLGRKGELESLTKNFFDAPVTSQESSTDGPPPRVGKMEPNKAAEFTKLANERITAMQVELDKMKKAHLKRMEKLRQSSALSSAEKRLRTVHLDSSGKSKGGPNANGISGDAPDALDEIAREVEGAIGRKVGESKLVTMVSKGGFLPELTPQPPVPVEVRNTSNTAGGVSHNQVPPPPPPPQQQQQQSQQPRPSQQQQQQPPPPPPQHQQQQQQQRQVRQQVQPQPPPSQQTSAAAIVNQPPQAISAPVEAATTQAEPQAIASNDNEMQQEDQPPDLGVDIDMRDLDDDAEMEDQPDEAGDWVMVGDKDVPDLSHVGSNPSGTPTGSHGPQQSQNANGANIAGPASGLNEAVSLSPHDSVQDQDQHDSGQTPLDTGEFDLGNDFENTAGDALAGFVADDDLNLDDSAFGDAFPPQD